MGDGRRWTARSLARSLDGMDASGRSEGPRIQTAAAATSYSFIDTAERAFRSRILFSVIQFLRGDISLLHWSLAFRRAGSSCGLSNVSEWYRQAARPYRGICSATLPAKLSSSVPISGNSVDCCCYISDLRKAKRRSGYALFNDGGATAFRNGRFDEVFMT